MLRQEIELLQHGSGFIYCGMVVCKSKTTTNKSKTTKNDFGGIMGKSKKVDICAPSCSAVQFEGQDRSWTGVDGALTLENLNLVNTIWRPCIMFRNFFNGFLRN